MGLGKTVTTLTDFNTTFVKVQGQSLKPSKQAKINFNTTFVKVQVFQHPNP